MDCSLGTLEGSQTPRDGLRQAEPGSVHAITRNRHPTRNTVRPCRTGSSRRSCPGPARARCRARSSPNASAEMLMCSPSRRASFRVTRGASRSEIVRTSLKHPNGRGWAGRSRRRSPGCGARLAARRQHRPPPGSTPPCARRDACREHLAHAGDRAAGAHAVTNASGAPFRAAPGSRVVVRRWTPGWPGCWNCCGMNVVGSARRSPRLSHGAAHPPPAGVRISSAPCLEAAPPLQ